MVTGAPGVGSVSLWCGRCNVVGRKFGGAYAGGKGTKVWRPLDAGRSRRKWEGGTASSHSMDGLKKGRSPAK